MQFRLLDFNGAVVHSFQPNSSIIPTVIVWQGRAFTKAASSGLDFREVSIINLDGATTAPPTPAPAKPRLFAQSGALVAELDVPHVIVRDGVAYVRTSGSDYCAAGGASVVA